MHVKSVQWVILRILLLALAASVTSHPAGAGESGPLYKGKSPVAWIRAVKDRSASIGEASRAMAMLGPKTDKCIPELLELLKSLSE
jgi:hypothetical protein